MKIECRIKKFLGIASLAPYKYCDLNLNPKNKKRCNRCKYFKVSEYTVYELGANIVKGIERAIDAINNLSLAQNQATEEELLEEEGVVNDK